MMRSAYSKSVLPVVSLVFLAASSCKTQDGAIGETSGRRKEVALGKDLMQEAGDCFTVDDAACVNAVPTTTPEKTIVCLGAYLAKAPKIDFSQAQATVNNIDRYREEGKDGPGGPVIIGSGKEVGLRALLRKHFTYKLCSDGKRYSYNEQALKNGYANSNDKGTIATIVATTGMSKKAERNKVVADDAAANDSNLAKVKFALDNLLCIRNLADVPCGSDYPTYVPITQVFGRSLGGVNNVIGAVKVPNANITLLPGLDPSQIAELHAEGIESENYDMRLNLIAGAKKSLLMAIWQIKQKEGDIAGSKLKDAVNKAVKNNHIQSAIVGDLSTSHGNPFFSQDGATPGEIPGAIIWGAGINKSYTYHRKLTVIDSETVIFGGKNYASEYMQQFHGSKDWRDTDVKIKSPEVAQLGSIMFANDWNNNTPPQVHMLKGATFRADCTPATGVTCFKFVSHDPARQTGTTGPDPVLGAMLEAITSARKTVDIENAYVIASYPLVAALRAAADKGVRVRILTNSDKSIDVPELGHVMNLNATAIAQNVKNVEVYLKQAGGTSTLHSKFMVVDGRIAFIGTYNLHPASRTTASEFMGVMEQVPDDATGPVAKLAKVFESDVRHLGRLLDKNYQAELGDAYGLETPTKKSAVIGILAMGYDTL